ncbi:MAG: hypothetical protein WCP74_12060 [Sphingobacteriia bacterium]
MNSFQMINKTEKKEILLNGGVLIIGSLLWDTDNQRQKWRNNSLEVDRRILVPAPIRYGRVSKERSCTFSMVFSNDCNQDNQIGEAIFVPFKDNPLNFEKMEFQTQELIKSERKKETLDSDKFNWGWGTLTISVNPKILNETSEKFNQAKLLLSYWRDKYSNGFNPNDYKVGQELPVLDKQGILNFSWTEKLNDFDFFIATATKPEREHYPTSKHIADRMLANEYSDYFRNNVQFGISTFQDKEILEALTHK